MKEYSISIIIPVYNGEKYLKKCLDSIICQTIFKELQVIVVNDGSTDGTLYILNDYETHYENIMVLNIPNAGVSNARNVGLEVASGNYVAFVDADDWIEYDCYEKMYKKVKESASDIVAAGFFVSDNDRDILKNTITNRESKKNQKEMILDFLTGKIDVHCSNKLFSKKTVEKVRFDASLKIAEDRMFLFETFLRAQTMYCMPEVFYHYYQNENSVMHNKGAELTMDSIKVAQEILRKTTLEFPDLEAYAESMYISTACRVYCEMPEKECKKNSQYTRLRDDIKEYKIVDAIHYMSVKHLIGFVLAQMSPGVFNKLRNNTFIRFIK